MRITTKTDYAVILLTELAKADQKPLSLQAVADLFHMSEAYLQRIAAQLKKAKLIKAKHGAYGGYLLNKSSDQISLHDVIDAVGDDIATVRCLHKNKKCSRAESCTSNAGWARFQVKLNELYCNTSIANMANQTTTNE